MSHGKPDWGVMAGREVIFGMDDLGELAARLGSVVTFDRRGNVVLIDDFEASVLHWSTGAAGAASAATLSTTIALRGNNSCKLLCDSGANDYIQIFRGLSYFASYFVGLEFSFSADNANVKWRLRGEQFDGSLRHIPAIEFNGTAQTLAYYDSNYAPQAFAANIKISAVGMAFYTCKLVYNWYTKKYIRFIFGPQTYDLSGYAYYSVGDSTAPMVRPLIEQLSLGVAQRTIYIDDFIFTQEEPV